MSDSTNDRSGDTGDASGSYEGSGDSVTVTTSQSWFARIGGALVGLLLSFLLVPGGSALLFWNEGRAVTTARSLTEGTGLVQDVSPDRPDPSREGRLIHVAGPVTIATLPRDPELDVSAPAGTLRLTRHVEMFQWKEEQDHQTRTAVGGSQTTTTTYRYVRVWEAARIDSSRFRQQEGHINPAARYADQAWPAQGARLGGFALDDTQLSQLPADRPVGDTRFIGQDGNNPRIGDLRVSWRAAAPAAISVVAGQQGQGFAPYATRAGDRLMLVQPGQVPAGAMFQQAEHDNMLITWALRAVGALLVFIGFALFFNPLKVLADVLPFLGGIVGFGAMLLAAVLTLLVAPTVIALAWLAFRPLIGAGILAVGLALAFGVSRLRRRAPTVRPA